MLYEGRFTFVNLIKLSFTSAFIFCGKIFYNTIDEFLKNNVWAFLLLFICVAIYSVSK